MVNGNISVIDTLKAKKMYEELREELRTDLNNGNEQLSRLTKLLTSTEKKIKDEADLFLVNDAFSWVKSSHPDLLKRKREDLVSLFIEQDVELLRKTFEYEKSPVAFSLVRSQFITQWINEHFEQITDDDISDEVRKSAVKVCSQLISEDKDKDSGIAEFKQAILKEKLKVESLYITVVSCTSVGLISIIVSSSLIYKILSLRVFCKSLTSFFEIFI